MRGSTGGALIAVALVVLTGCIGATPEGPNASPTADDDPSEGNVTPDHAGAAPHVHDLWQGATTRELVNDTYDLIAVDRDPEGDGPVGEQVRPNACRAGYLSTCLGSVSFMPPGPDGDHRYVVPPGTGALEVTISWDSPTITGVFLQYRPAYDDDHIWDTGAFETSGQTRTIAAPDVNTTWTQFPLTWTDDGHAQLSRWRFRAHAYTDGESIAFSEGAIQVSIRVLRGDGPLPAEPPHPDWYGDRDRYLLAAATQNVDGALAAPGDSEEVRKSIFGTSPGLDLLSPVPPGTKEVLVVVNYTNESPFADSGLLTSDFEFYWNAGPWLREEAPDERTDRQAIFRVPVTEAMTDSIYTCNATKSVWSVSLGLHGDSTPKEDPVVGWGLPQPMYYEGRFDVRVVAAKDPGMDPAAAFTAPSDPLPCPDEASGA